VGVLGNYTITYNTASFTINVRPITVKAATISRVFGSSTPSFSIFVSVGSLASVDTLASLGTPTFTTSPTNPAINVGSYTIALGSLGNSNYSIGYDKTGTLAITPAPTTTTVISSKNPSFFGGLVMFTATVTNTSTNPAPTGALTITVDGGSPVAATVSGSGNTLTATYSIATLVATSLHTVKATYTNSDGNFGPSGPASLTQTVNPAPTISAVTVTPNSQQYSDPLTFTATLTPDMINGVNPATSVTFFVGTQQITGAPTLVDSSGVLTWTLSNVVLLEPAPFGTAPTGQMAPGNHNVTAVFGNLNPNFSVANPWTSLKIAQEDARVTYAGNLFYGIPQTAPTGTITLIATIQDITAVTGDPVYDPYPGDIRNATLTFVDRATNATLCTASVLLVNSSDTKTGSVTCTFTGVVDNTGSKQYMVGMVVSGYYTRNSSSDNTLVTISQVGPGMITGGGFLVMQNSAGTIAGDPGTHNNFGFNVQYKQSGQNPHGNINSIVRRMEKDGIQHVYQIKGNSMSTLAVYQWVSINSKLQWVAGCTGATSTSPCKAQFNGSANIQDITNPLAPVSVTGNNSLQFNMTDYGSPGSGDTIGITLWNGSGGIWFSTNWVGTPPATVEQLLGGGNLVVH
jgi:hypothetical protein